MHTGSLVSILVVAAVDAVELCTAQRRAAAYKAVDAAGAALLLGVVGTLTFGTLIRPTAVMPSLMPAIMPVWRFSAATRLVYTQTAVCTL